MKGPRLSRAGMRSGSALAASGTWALLLAPLLTSGSWSRPAHADADPPPIAAPATQLVAPPEGIPPGRPPIDLTRVEFTRVGLTRVSASPGGIHKTMAVGGAWQAQGPGLALNGQAENVPGSNPVCGAINMLAAHPTNADILYAGAVNGGIWRTTNATAGAPTWTPLTDQFPSPSVGDLEFDPTDGGHQTLVAGFGNFSSFGVGGPLVGLLRTTDGGNTWTQLGQTDLSGLTVWAVAPRGNTILVGTDGGLYRSTDGGASFQNISGSNGLNTGNVFDLETDPSDNQRIYAAVGGGGGGVFRTDDTGANWNNVTSAAIDALVSGSTGNMVMAVSAAAGNAVFVGIVNNGRLAGVFRSANQGGAWTAMDLPRTQEGALAIGIHPGGQGSTHFSFVADPTDGNIVYVGGDRQPANPGPDNVEAGPNDTDDTFPNSIGANAYSGRLFRGNAGVAPTGAVPSPQWTPLTHSGTGSNSSPHADSRDMDFDANGNIVESDDGGIYRRTNPRLGTGNWFSVIGTLQVGQFHDIAYDGNFNVIVGGTQDTGCPTQTASGSTTWTELAQADGGDVAVDDTSVPGQSTFYWSTQFLGGFRRRTCTGANVCGANTNIALNVLGGGNPIGRSFVTPIALNSQDQTRLIVGGTNSVYESSDQGANVTELNSPGVTSNGMVYGHPSNDDLIVIGSGNRVFVRTTAGGALTATATNPPGAGTITDIAVDPANASVMYAVDASSVFSTPDGGATWTDITGNLSDISGGSIQTVAYIEGTTNDILVVGAQQGVFALFAPFCGCWDELGTGLPNTFAWELDYNVADDLLIAGTMGRGAFTLGAVAGLVAPANLAPIVALDATGGNVDNGCAFLAPYHATITDNCSINIDSIRVSAISLDGHSTVGTPTVTLDVVSLTEVNVSGVVEVSALTACPAAVRITVVAMDGCGLKTTESKDIQVNDVTPPSITVQLNRNYLWPPNHKLATIQATVVVSDNCPVTSWILESATSDEPENDRGDGNTAPDIVGAAIGTRDSVFQLRSERQGIGDGRDYTIVFAVSDGCGNTSRAIKHVLVPHDHSGSFVTMSGLTDNSIDPEATSVLLAIPSIVLQTADTEEMIVTRGGESDETVLAFDASSIVLDQIQLGNTDGVVAPDRVDMYDVTNDGIGDRILEFPAAPLRALLSLGVDANPLALRCVTKSGESYLVPDILGSAAVLDKPDAAHQEPLNSRRAPSSADPVKTRLGEIRPSPFSTATSVAFDLARPGHVRLQVYDVLGRLVRTLVTGDQAAGQHRVTWDGLNNAGRRVGTGVYLVLFNAGGVTERRTVVRMN